MNPETLKAIIENRATSPADRAAAQQQLGEPKSEQGQPSGHPLEPELLQFAGAARLEDIPAAIIVRFVEASTADPDALAALGADWNLMRCLQGFPVAEQTWNATNRDRAAFERLTQRHPFLGPSPITLRLWSEEVEYLRTLCEQRGERAARRYFVPQIQALSDRLPEYAFDSRDAARNLLDRYQNGDNHDEHRN